ncbi:MAG: ribokinase [Nocardioidaceae bacterium]|jgi:ribokinase|nr:ribokinase [Nocardioidaceae bacterium]
MPDANGSPGQVEEKSSHAILVVGSVNRDYVCRVEAIPRAGETVLGARLSLGSGGKGGNQAVAAAKMGVRTALVACVGSDPDGRALLADLTAAGVDVDDVATVDETRSGVAFVMVAKDGENSIVVAPGANERLDPGSVREAIARGLRRGDVLVVQAEIPLACIVSAVTEAERSAGRVVFNLAPYRDVPADVLAACDPLVVNEGEARALLGIREADRDGDAAEMAALIRRLTRSAVITLGASGAVVAYGEEVRHVPTSEVAAVDTTGAGDAFTGALAAALCRGAGLVPAVELGVAAGSFAVGRPGAQSSFPTLAELSG